MPSEPPPILAVIFRCLGIYLIFQAISQLPTLAPYFDNADDVGSYRGLLFASASLHFIGAAFFFIFARPLANVVGGDRAAVPADALLLGIQLVGLYWFVSAISDTAFNIFQIRLEQDEQKQRSLVDLPSFPYIVYAVVQLALSAFLVLRSTVVARWMRFREEDPAPQP